VSPDDGSRGAGVFGALEVLMSTLRVYSLARELVRNVNQLLPRIAERSRDLADQVDRSARSVAANIAEGEHRHDGNGRQRFKTARETRAHLEMAMDVGALHEAEVASAIDLADHISAGLYKLLRNRSAA
jgi:four helix bundle protein